jgi:hypothetical protein
MTNQTIKNTEALYFVLAPLGVSYKYYSGGKSLENIKIIINSFNGDFDINLKCVGQEKNNQSLVETLARLPRYASDKSEWIDYICEITEGKELDIRTWVSVYLALCENIRHLDIDLDKADILKWSILAKKEWWTQDSKIIIPLIKMLVESDMVQHVEGAISCGVSPDTILDCEAGDKRYDIKVLPHSLLAWSKSSEMTKMLLKNGANPNLVVDGETPLSVIFRRGQTDFVAQNSGRLEIEALLKEASLAKPMAKKERYNQLFMSYAAKIEKAEDTHGLQEALNFIGADLKNIRGNNGETPLQHILLNKPEFATKLMRSKHKDINWFNEKDLHGCDATHYAALGKARGRFDRSGASLIKLKQLMSENIKNAPVSVDEWAIWFKKYWSRQEFIANRLNSNRYRDKLGLETDEYCWYEIKNEDSTKEKAKFLKLIDTWEGVDLISAEVNNLAKRSADQNVLFNFKILEQHPPEIELNKETVHCVMMRALEKMSLSSPRMHFGLNDQRERARNDAYEKEFSLLLLWIRRYPDVWAEKEKEIKTPNKYFSDFMTEYFINPRDGATWKEFCDLTEREAIIGKSFGFREIKKSQKKSI